MQLQLRPLDTDITTQANSTVMEILRMLAYSMFFTLDLYGLFPLAHDTKEKQKWFYNGGRNCQISETALMKIKMTVLKIVSCFNWYGIQTV